MIFMILAFWSLKLTIWKSMNMSTTTTTNNSRSDPPSTPQRTEFVTRNFYTCLQLIILYININKFCVPFCEFLSKHYGKEKKHLYSFRGKGHYRMGILFDSENNILTWLVWILKVVYVLFFLTNRKKSSMVPPQA